VAPDSGTRSAFTPGATCGETISHSRRSPLAREARPPLTAVLPCLRGLRPHRLGGGFSRKDRHPLGSLTTIALRTHLEGNALPIGGYWSNATVFIEIILTSPAVCGKESVTSCGCVKFDPAKESVSIHFQSLNTIREKISGMGRAE